VRHSPCYLLDRPYVPGAQELGKIGFYAGADDVGFIDLERHNRNGFENAFNIVRRSVCRCRDLH